MHDLYLEEKHEARAMGDYDFVSFEAWSGNVTARECADERAALQYDNDTQDLF
tara:strand:+ start:333 stop:491 length:159 start_codon:yes stop_codon:yes gene_type:complete